LSKLEIDGLADSPLSLTLEDIKARPRQEVTFTLECSGNTGLPFFDGGIGTATWAGTPLGPLLLEAGLRPEATEVVFWGTDAGDVEIRDMTLHQNFARSMFLAEAADPRNLLVYEMNGEPLPEKNGFPLRLIAPGWYGIANVKWLKRIALTDRRLENQFMARDYVTIRETERNGETVWEETSVGPARLKSAPGRVTKAGTSYRITGAAWGAPISQVEVKIDDGPWRPASLDTSEQAEFAWTIWSYEWPNPSPGEHTITSRATDTDGDVQPATDDPLIAGKKTYWESNGQITRRVMIEG
jgi:DMSO/TMAO reductase YedYZ molybdopterin-dependent catalytic subunit